jgi:hypothetical protein
MPDFYLDMQLTLSSLLYLIDHLTAGILHFKDIVSLNKEVSAAEVKNFFCLMEIYGAGSSADKEKYFHQPSHY